MKFTESFESSRFSASPVACQDWADLLQAVTSQQFPRELGLAKITTEQQAKDWLSGRVSDWQKNKSFVWSIRHHGKSQVIGQLCLAPREHDLALAYWVHPDCWGQGITTEIARALIELIDASGFAGKVWAGAHSWNSRSIAVLNKLGFEFTGEGKHTSANGQIEIIKEFILIPNKIIK